MLEMLLKICILKAKMSQMVFFIRAIILLDDYCLVEIVFVSAGRILGLRGNPAYQANS